MPDLFRTEAVNARADHRLGRIVLVRPITFGFLTAIGVAFAVAVVLFLCLGQYTKRAHVQGLLVPDKGLIRVMAPSQGVITERRVQEGDAVRAGQVLFVLTTERQFSGNGVGAQGATVNASEAILQTLQVRKQSLNEEKDGQQLLLEKQRDQLARRVHDMNAEAEKMGQQVATQKQRLASAKVQIKRLRELVSQQFYSEAALQQKEDDLLDQRGRVQALEQAHIQLMREAASSQSEFEQLEVKASREKQQLARAMSEIDQADISTESQRRLAVIAPADGTVSAVMAEPGMSTGTQPLLTLLPANAVLEAQLYAPSSAAGFVQPGQTVLLRYAAFPYQKFGQYQGRVESISRSAISPQEVHDALPGASPQAGEGLYRIRVKLNTQDVSVYGKPQKLNAGMQLEADILQDTRRLLEWVFEPVFSLKSSL
ncbi:MAG: HlyD family efflux transporter periplasmic adaptor subunit [Rhizobacter sp.]